MVANSRPWTVRDLDAMRDEIVDGELFVTRAPHIQHQSAASKIHVRLGNWSEKTGLGHAFQVPGVVFSPTNAVSPIDRLLNDGRIAIFCI